MKLHHLWQDRLWIVEYEGGPVLCVKFRTWWNFIKGNPKYMNFSNPGRPLQAYQFKCFAGFRVGLKVYGYDFIMGRLWRKWEAERLLDLKRSECPEGVDWEPSVHAHFRRDSKPFTPWLAWCTAVPIWEIKSS